MSFPNPVGTASFGWPRSRWPASSFVAELPDAERAALLAAGEYHRFADEEVLLVQGEPGDCVYVLTGGLVKVIVGAEGGAQTTLAIRSRGDLLGEESVLDQKPRMATARAVGPATALKIEAAAFTDIISRSPAAQVTVTRYVLSKMPYTTERRAAERVWDAKERIAQVLYQLGERHAEPGPDGTIRLPITQDELGDLAGVAVSTVERVLKELREAGAVATKYREIGIRDMAYLDSIRFPQENAEKPLQAGNWRAPIRYGRNWRRPCGGTVFGANGRLGVAAGRSLFRVR